jgi:tetraacyldisaccharide 4'-kinase
MTLPEFLYYIGYSIKKLHSYKKLKQLPYPVVSIGNITVGGTGKTPATIAIAEEAKKRGFYPIILTRGYKGKAKGPCFVLARKPGSPEVKDFRTSALPRFCSSALDAGDEPVLMAERLKDVPIVKCADRYKGGVFAIENLKSQISNPKSKIVFILDDGFQRWRLYRDLDIVLIDGSNPFGNRKLLPSGPLREPLSELKRADMFVVTKTRNEELINELKGFNSSAPVYFSEYKTIKLRNISGEELPVEALKDKRVFAFCGLANPESFKQTALSVCGEMGGFKTYRDHYKYETADIKYLEEQSKRTGCDFLLTTEKDMAKIKEFRISDFKSQILCLQIAFSAEPAFFDSVFRNIS